MHCLWIVVSFAVAAAPSGKALVKKTRPPEKSAVAPAKKSTPPPSPAVAPLTAGPADKQGEVAQPADSAGAGLDLKPLSVGGFVGPSFFFSGGPTVMRVGAQFEARVLRLSDGLRVEFEAPFAIGFARQTVSFGGFFEMTTDIVMVELAPSLQLSGELIPNLEVYGGFGLGPVVSWATTPVQFQGHQTSSTAGVLVRFGGGARYRYNDKVGFFFEPINFGIYAMSGADVNIGGTTVRTSGSSAAAFQISLGASYLL